MNVNPSVIVRARITMPDGEVWYASSPQVGGSPEKTIEYLNRQSQRRRLGSTYALATEKEYWEYRDQSRSRLQRGGTFLPTQF